MSTNPPLKLNNSSISNGDAPAHVPTIQAMLVPADVAGSMCARSEASWWRDHAAGRIPAPIKLGGRTLWRVQELRDWVEAGCPSRKNWETLKATRNGGRP